MLGWRKLGAWFLSYMLVVGCVYGGVDIPANALKYMTWVTGFFFGANALKPLAQGIKVNLGPAKP